jgi:serine/threonine-protein kinase
MSTITPQITPLVSGRYRIQKVLGRGGMSTVYRATDIVLGRPVAVKVLLAALADGDPSYIARFQREARAAASLRHPAVVKIYDTGVEHGEHYIVMEYVPGQGLQEVIRERRLGHREAARIASQVAEAVAAAHTAGVLHRDIKPANVILRPDGGVKVLDFGVARTVEETTITNPAFAVGTVSYMAPERVLGRPGDERTDIYGIGCLLYALLTGRPPFVADESMAILHQQVHAEPVPPSAAGAAVSPGLDRLILRMLAKDPADRPQSAAEVAKMLAAAAAETEPTLVAPVPWARSSAVFLGDRGRLRRLPLAALALAAAVILIVFLVGIGGGSAKRAAGASVSVRRDGARLGRASSRVDAMRRAGLRAAASPTPATSPAGQQSSPAAAPPPPPPGPAKKPGPPGPRKHAARLPPGHGGIPPGQARKHGHGHGPGGGGGD